MIDFAVMILSLATTQSVSASASALTDNDVKLEIADINVMPKFPAAALIVDAAFAAIIVSTLATKRGGLGN